MGRGRNLQKRKGGGGENPAFPFMLLPQFLPAHRRAFEGKRKKEKEGKILSGRVQQIAVQSKRGRGKSVRGRKERMLALTIYWSEVKGSLQEKRGKKSAK